jgi:signal transduction histidine kinase
MERTFDISKSQAVGKCVYDVLPFLKHIGENKFFETVLSGRAVASHFRPFTQARTPGQRYFDAQYSPLFECTGDVVGAIALIRDVTERHNAQERIEQLNSDLQRKNRELETIISVASHDIRAPLVNVQGFSKELVRDCESLGVLLGNAALTQGQRKEATRLFEELNNSIGFIQNSATAVDILLTNLLTVTKAGLTELTLKSVDINAVFTELIKNLEYKFKQAGATISIAQLPSCNADEDQIKQVFSNIVDNAIKYLDPSRPGHITVSGYTQGDRAIYCIEDNGVGIPEQKKEKIFEFFLRLDGTAANGEGIGLAIVRRIIEKHRGRVWVESEVGKGSKFYVALPL